MKDEQEDKIIQLKNEEKDRMDKETIDDHF